jgi:hypothetical protein
MAEDYVRPPVVALEPRSRRAAIWRFRVYLIIALLLLGFGIFLVAKAIVGGGEGSPSIGNQTLAALSYRFGGSVLA